MKDRLTDGDPRDASGGGPRDRTHPTPPPGVRPGSAPHPGIPGGAHGNAGGAGWNLIDLDGRTVAIRKVTAERAEAPTLLAVGAPRLVTGRDGAPVLSLTALLAADPEPGATSLVPLVEAGQLAVEATCGLGQGEIDALAARFGRPVSAPPGAATTIGLADAGTAIAEGTAHGTAARIALSGRIGREAAIEVMNAMNEAADPETARLVLSATVRSRAEGASLHLRLRGRWAELWDALAAEADGEGRVPEAAIDAAVMRLLGEGRLTLTGPDGAPVDDLASAVAMFARVSGFVLGEHPLGGKVLRARPAESFPLDVSETRSIAGEAAKAVLQAPLAVSVARLFAGRGLEAHLSFVALATGGGRRVREPRRVRSSRRDGVGAKAAAMPEAAFALGTGKALSAATALRPVVRPTAVSVAHNLMHLPAAILDKPVASDPEGPRSLPVVTDAMVPSLSGVLRDRVSQKVRWYVPDYTLAGPDGDGDGEGAQGFRFEIERIGATDTGDTALRARLAFRLSGGPPKNAADEIAHLRGRGTGVRPVALRDVSVALVIPYVDSATGHLRRQRLACEAVVEGEDIACRVEIANQWVRLAYGALSRLGFQFEPATVEVHGRFETYAPIDQRGSGALIGPKVRRAGEIRHDQFGLRIEGAGGAVSVAGQAALAPVALSVAATPLAARPATGVLAIRPQLELSPSLVATLSRTLYAEKDRDVRRSTPALVSCNRHPGAYVERTDGGTRVIGCQDALLLGQGTPELLEEILPLRMPGARIFRLLTQPDVFLALPACYRLTRRGDGAAQVPAIALYSILDAEMDDNTRFVFDFTLQPDLSPAERRDLLLRLAPYAAAPLLRYPGEMPLDDVEASLLVGAEPLHANDGVFLDISVSGDLTQAMLVKSLVESSGLRGSVRFIFADGSAFESAIDVTIANVPGPWDTGPVEAVPSGRRIRLRNRTESGQEVSEVLAVAPYRRLAVSEALGPGESREIEIEAEHAEAYAVASPTGSPGSIEERRAFIEDVRSSVIFLAMLDFEALSIAAVEVDAEIVATGERHAVTLSAALPAAEIAFRLPVTELLSRPRLRFSTARVGTDGVRVPAAPREADLSQSAVIQITSGAGS